MKYKAIKAQDHYEIDRIFNLNPGWHPIIISPIVIPAGLTSEERYAGERYTNGGMTSSAMEAQLMQMRAQPPRIEYLVTLAQPGSDEPQVQPEAQQEGVPPNLSDSNIVIRSGTTGRTRALRTNTTVVEDEAPF